MSGPALESIPEAELELGKELGRGAFGAVLSAKYRGLDVCVKVCCVLGVRGTMGGLRACGLRHGKDCFPHARADVYVVSISSGSCAPRTLPEGGFDAAVVPWVMFVSASGRDSGPPYSRLHVCVRDHHCACVRVPRRRM